MYMKKIILGILLGILLNGNYLASIMDNSTITCDKVIDADVDNKSNNEETNKKLMKKKTACKA